MEKESSQKFVACNRAPRVQIEYDLEVYGAEKKINLPLPWRWPICLVSRRRRAAVADRNCWKST